MQDTAGQHMPAQELVSLLLLTARTWALLLLLQKKLQVSTLLLN
jgi:hypothetical protein